MDPYLQTLATQLADTAIRNTAGSIADRITAAKARKKDQETIAELEEIVYGLLSDKSELVQIAQAFEQELVAQRISDSDIRYISTNFVPLLQRFMESAAASDDQSATIPQEVIDLIQPLLSVETVTVLQLIGFNFRKAIGEPLTEFVRKLILSKAQVDPAQVIELQRLSLARDAALFEAAQNPEAQERLDNMLSTQQ